MNYQDMKFSLAAVLVALLCSHTQLVAETTIISSPLTIGNINESVSQDNIFMLSVMPSSPVLGLSIKVNTIASCMKNYRPTTLLINGKNFSQLDFRQFNPGDEIKHNWTVAADYLRIGENKITVITGECQFGVDSLRINQMSLIENMDDKVIAVSPIGRSNAGGDLALVSESTNIGNDQGSVQYETEFMLSTIPAQPKLNIQFKVETTSSCPNSYDATTLMMNGNQFAELDFLEFDSGDDKNFVLDVPPKYLHIGRNSLVVVTGECAHGVDSMNMNKMILMQ